MRCAVAWVCREAGGRATLNARVRGLGLLPLHRRPATTASHCSTARDSPSTQPRSHQFEERELPVAGAHERTAQRCCRQDAAMKQPTQGRWRARPCRILVLLASELAAGSFFWSASGSSSIWFQGEGTHAFSHFRSNTRYLSVVGSSGCALPLLGQTLCQWLGDSVLLRLPLWILSCVYVGATVAVIVVRKCFGGQLGNWLVFPPLSELSE